ncbi:hypothetical protein R1sor_020795 [Riccia sorocarpa]|uniref:Sm domain-containing protein n=1 Tax=Riccia sorocarpa TaxID=122646 RepID=A0ABD3GKV7_9MARC
MAKVPGGSDGEGDGVDMRAPGGEVTQGPLVSTFKGVGDGLAGGVRGSVFGFAEFVCGRTLEEVITCQEYAGSGAGGNSTGVLSAKTPADFLKSIRGRPVVVKLNSGVDYRGILACLDGYMNIAMEQTEEYVNGQLKNKYGDAFIRGNNVLYISTTKRTLADQ